MSALSRGGVIAPGSHAFNATERAALCRAAGRERRQARAVAPPAIEGVRRAACDASIGSEKRASGAHERGCDDSCE